MQTQNITEKMIERGQRKAVLAFLERRLATYGADGRTATLALSNGNESSLKVRFRLIQAADDKTFFGVEINEVMESD